jgi:histidine phosphotransferase ChpT
VNHQGLRLAELLTTRLCHDLAGPLSGLGMALGEAPRDPEALALAHDAALALRRRLALLRAAWGEAASALDATELTDLAQGLPNAHRLALVFDLRPAGADFTPAAGRVVLNALLLAAESLPRGGTLSLSGDPARDVVVAIAGPGAAWPVGLGALLRDPAPAWTAIAAAQGPAGVRGLQAPVTALLAEAAGVRASLLLARAAEPLPPLLLDCSTA